MCASGGDLKQVLRLFNARQMLLACDEALGADAREPLYSHLYVTVYLGSQDHAPGA